MDKAKIISWIKKTDERVYRIEQTTVWIMLSVMVLLVFFDFLLRETIRESIHGAQKLALYLMIWVGFIGASLATKEKKHLKMDLLEKILSPHISQRFKQAILLLTGFCALFLTKVGYDYVLLTYSYHDPPLVYNIPEWTVQAVIPLSLLVISMRYLGQFFAAFSEGKKPQAKKEDS